jgi:hypothetical protein
MKGAAKPTIGLILMLALMFVGLRMLGWGVEKGTIKANPEKITSQLKILQPKDQESREPEKSKND